MPILRADALVEMAPRSGTMPKGGKAPHPLFTLVLGRDGFNHRTRVASGQVVPPEAILPWISEADLRPIAVLFEQHAGPLPKVGRMLRQPVGAVENCRSNGLTRARSR